MKIKKYLILLLLAGVFLFTSCNYDVFTTEEGITVKRIYSNANDKNVCKRVLYIGDDGYIYCDKELTEKVNSEVLMNFAGKDLVTIFDASGVQYTPVNFNKVDDYVVVTIFDSNGDLQYLYSSEHPEQIVPEKGQLIEMNIEGTPHKYRVLKTNNNDSKVLVVDMTTRYEDEEEETPFEKAFDTRYPAVKTYSGSALDTYLNTTLYDTFTNEAKNAIEEVEIQQYEYDSIPDSYDKDDHPYIYDYESKTALGDSIHRKVYALDIEDIEEYFEGEYSAAELGSLLWDREFPLSDDDDYCDSFWTRSAGTTDDGDNYGSAFALGLYEEEVTQEDLSFNLIYYPIVETSYIISPGVAPTRAMKNAIRPAFVIDLSKIDWTLVE